MLMSSARRHEGRAQPDRHHILNVLPEIVVVKPYGMRTKAVALPPLIESWSATRPQRSNPMDWSAASPSDSRSARRTSPQTQIGGLHRWAGVVTRHRLQAHRRIGRTGAPQGKFPAASVKHGVRRREPQRLGQRAEAAASGSMSPGTSKPAKPRRGFPRQRCGQSQGSMRR